MRKWIIVMGCLLLFCPNLAFGQQRSLNGTEWGKVDLLTKVFYLRGFSDGHFAGMSEGYTVILKAVVAAIPASAWTPKEEAAFLKKIAESDRRSGAHAPFTLGQLESTVSIFYDDFRNTPVCWKDAVRFANSSLEGNTPTEKELQAAREADAKSGCP